MKNRTTGLLLTCCLLLVACQYSVPLSNEQNINIDEALLGSWSMLPEEDDPNASLDSMSVTRSSNTEYSVKYVSEGVELQFRTYLINPGGETLIQMELLEGNEGPLSDDDDTPRFIVVRYSMDHETLTVQTMNSELVSPEIDNTEALLEAYLEHKDNPELFVNPGRFKKS